MRKEMESKAEKSTNRDTYKLHFILIIELHMIEIDCIKMNINTPVNLFRMEKNVYDKFISIRKFG